MKLVLVENMDQVLAAALRRRPRPLKPSPAQPARAGTSPATHDRGAAPPRPPLFPPQQPPAVA